MTFWNLWLPKEPFSFEMWNRSLKLRCCSFCLHYRWDDFLEIMVDVLIECLFRHPLSPKRAERVTTLYCLFYGFTFDSKYNFSSCHKFSMGFKSGLSGGVRYQFISFSSKKALARLVVCWDHYPAQIRGLVASDWWMVEGLSPEYGSTVLHPLYHRICTL